MGFIGQVNLLFRHELRTELRRKSMLGGILLHLFSSVYITKLAVIQLQLPVWNALFWVVVIFATVQGIAKSFLQVGPGRWLYYYQLSSPEAALLAKVIYNFLLFLLLGFTALLLYGLLFGIFPDGMGRYMVSMSLTGLGIAAVFTLVSAISCKVPGGGIAMPVLSFPVLIPVMLTGIAASKKALDGIQTNSIYKDWAVLFLLDIMIIILSLILFRFLWKE